MINTLFSKISSYLLPSMAVLCCLFCYISYSLYGELSVVKKERDEAILAAIEAKKEYDKKEISCQVTEISFLDVQKDSIVRESSLDSFLNTLNNGTEQAKKPERAVPNREIAPHVKDDFKTATEPPNGVFSNSGYRLLVSASCKASDKVDCNP